MESTISLCMIVKNEESNLARCLQSIRGLVDEIIIVDTGSTDRTVEIGIAAGGKVVSLPWQENFSHARNASLALASGDWILFLDADEELAAGCAESLRQLTTLPAEGFFVKIINYIGSDGQVETSPDLVFRMFRNKPEYRFRGAIHEQIADVILEHNPSAAFSVAETVVLRHYGYLEQQIRAKDKKSRNLALIEKECRQFPDNLTLRYHYGVELFRGTRYAEAADEFTAVANALDPAAVYYPKLLRYLALAHYAGKQPLAALAAIETGLAFFPDYADLYYYRGLIQFELTRFSEAVESFSLALSMPEQPAYYAPFDGSRGFRAAYQLGRLAETFGNEEEALGYYIASLRDKAGFTPALQAIIAILKPRENPDYTREALEKLFDFCTPQAKLLLGNLYFAERAYLPASQYLEQAASADPAVAADTAVLRAICLAQGDRTLEALRLLAAVPAGHAHFLAARLQTLLIFWFAGNRKKVRSLSDALQLSGVSPETTELLSLLLDSLYKRRSIPPAVVSGEMLDITKDILHRALALGKPALAEALLARLAKEIREAHSQDFAAMFAAYGYFDTALAFARQAVTLFPDRPDAWRQLAEILSERQEYDEACLCYRQALQLAPRQPLYYHKLLLLYRKIREQLAGQALALYPEATWLRSFLPGEVQP